MTIWVWQSVDQGMLPNRFPEAGEAPEYNTVDGTLWYFEAIRAYHAATGDHELLRELLPVLQDIIDWHERGTRYSIHMDPEDSLPHAGEAGVQLTWMDAKVGDWVVTPRIGKPVEINALWYNGLRSMAEFARRLGEPTDQYDAMAERVCIGFVRFWNEAGGYCYDVIDGLDGDDPALARSYLMPLARHLASHGVGSISEIFDGDAPFNPSGCIAQAWGVAELLRAWQATVEF